MILQRINIYQQFIFVLIIFLAYLLQIKIGVIFNSHFNLVFSALIVLIFFVDYLTLWLLSFMAIFLLNWKPAISLELVLLFLILQLLYLICNKISWQNWIKVVVLLFLGLAVFYIAVNFNLVLKNFIYLFYDILVSLIFGLTLFYFLEHIKYEK